MNLDYPYRQLQNGEYVTVRFLPDLDQDNLLEFIDGYYVHYHNTADGRRLPSLCSKSISNNNSCIFCKTALRYFDKGPSHSDQARKYYKVNRYSVNALIVHDPLMLSIGVDTAFHLTLNKPIFNQIKEGILTLDTIPSDYDNGYDFVIMCEEIQRGFKKFEGHFIKKSRCLTKEEREIANKSLAVLKDYRPNKLPENFDDELSKELMFDILSNT